MKMADVNKDGKKRQKRSTACDLLASIHPEVQISDYRLVGRYLFDGDGEKVYVMEINIDGKTFQGIGFSKKKARSMAAENALMFKGNLLKLTEEPHSPEDEPYNWNDFTADNVDKRSNLYYNFVEGKLEVDAEEDDDEWMESLVFDLEDENQHLVGKNTISILSELHPDTTYELVSAVFDKHKIFFVMSTNVNGSEFKGSGPNKRLAKARAAREALKELYKMEFGVLEDGMPVYEGDEQIWRWYKTKLEERATRTDFSKTTKNPLREIHELYPDVKFSFPYQSDRPESDSKFTAQVQIEGQIYEDEGTSKKLAKANVAEAVIDALMKSGIYDKKMKEIEEKKKARDIKRLSERPKFLLENFRSALTKLNEMRPSLEYKVLAETPLKNTCITAFTVGVTVDGKDYVSVGKNKRMAKLEVAEKVLRDLGAWSEEDEETKNKLLQELLESDNIQESYSIRSQKGPVDLMKLVNKDMSRKEMLKMVNQQLGLNLPSHLFSNNPENRGKRLGHPEGVNAVLDELDMIVESVLGPRSGQDSEGPMVGRQGRGVPARLPPPRRGFECPRDRFNNSRGMPPSNWGNQNRPRPYEDKRRLPNRNPGIQNAPPPPQRGFNSRPALSSPQVFQGSSQQTPGSWYVNDQNKQWNQNKPWSGEGSQKSSNYFWNSGEQNQNYSWGSYGRQSDTLSFPGTQVEPTWDQFSVAAPPPPPPPPPSTQTVQYPGLGNTQTSYYTGQQCQTPNYQGYDYSNSGYFNQWSYQNTDSSMQSNK